MKGVLLLKNWVLLFMDKFSSNIITRVFFIMLTSVLWAFLLVYTKYWFTFSLISIVIVLQGFSLVKYAQQNAKKLAQWLEGITQEDFGQYFSMENQTEDAEKLSENTQKNYQNITQNNTQNDTHCEEKKHFSSPSKRLLSIMNATMHNFADTRRKEMAQQEYTQAILQHIPVGILVLDNLQNVQTHNNTLLKILSCNYFDNLNKIAQKYPPLFNFITEKNKTQHSTLQLFINNATTEVVINKNTIIVLGKTYQIISIQNIQEVLDAKELEAWQNLMRVLTHEIINSITPITSLSNTLSDQMAEQFAVTGTYEDFAAQDIEDTHKAIQVIQKRSAGLVHFVTDVRNFTKIPAPKFKLFPIKPFFENIRILMQEEFKRYQVNFEGIVSFDDLQIVADEELIEQVIINLVKNATQAFDNQKDNNQKNKKISLICELDEKSKVVIKVKDNGVGIDEEAQKRIFVPFFTTKKQGSGIGLSLSRQIMQAHGGTLSVHSSKGNGATFLLHFA